MTNAEIDKIIDRALEKSGKQIQKYIAKITEESKEEMKQYIGAISEQSEHQIEAVAEQYQGLNEKVDRVITSVEQLNDKAENTNVRLAGVEIELAEVKRISEATFEAVGNHEERITVLEEKVR